MKGFAVGFLLLGGCYVFGGGEPERSTDAMASEVSTKPVATDTAELEVVIDVGKNPLGTYEMELVFNPRAGRLLSIHPGRAFGFDAAPRFNDANFPSGHVRVFDAHTMPAGPEGEVHVLTLRFAASPAPGVEVRELKSYDCHSRQIAGRGFVRPHYRTP